MVQDEVDFWLAMETVSSFDLPSDIVDELASSNKDEPSEDDGNWEFEFNNCNWFKCAADWPILSKLELSEWDLTAGLGSGGGVTLRCFVANNLFNTDTCDWQATTINGLYPML